MKKLVFLIAFLSSLVLSDTWCEISEFTVDAYDHGGVYLNGKLNGQEGPYVKNVSYVVIAGSTEGATNRRTSVALAAQMASKSLEVYFKDLNSCSVFTEYTAATTLRIKL